MKRWIPTITLASIDIDAPSDDRNAEGTSLIIEWFDWLFEIAIARKADERRCSECGCTETRACWDNVNGGCHWVGVDLCSACEPAVLAMGDVDVALTAMRQRDAGDLS